MRYVYLLFLVLAAAAAGAYPELTARPSPEVQRILGRVEQQYLHCKSYRDSGVVESGGAKAADRETIRFKTLFARPKRLRFDFLTTDYRGRRTDQGVLWADGTLAYKSYIEGVEQLHEVRGIMPVVHTWRKGHGMEDEKDIGMAVGGFTGISLGAANTVPNLLLPKEVTSLNVTRPNRSELLSEAKLGSRPCYRIRCAYVPNLQFVSVLWIDKQSYAIRRIVESEEMHPGRIQMGTTTTTYSPEFNVPIRPAAFRYKPPRGSGHH